jgi:hypothetical protein
VTRDYTVSIVSAYRLSTNKITLSDLNKDIPGNEPQGAWCQDEIFGGKVPVVM